MKTEPAKVDKVEVLAWMSRTRRSAADAVDQFWPELAGEERRRKGDLVRKWASDARKAGSPLAPPLHQAPAVEPPNREPPSLERTERPALDMDRVRLGRVPAFELECAELEADLKQARRDPRQASRVPQLNARWVKTRQALDDARAQEGIGNVPLDRTPDSVIEQVERRHQAIKILKGG